MSRRWITTALTLAVLPVVVARGLHAQDAPEPKPPGSADPPAEPPPAETKEPPIDDGPPPPATSAPPPATTAPPPATTTPPPATSSVRQKPPPPPDDPPPKAKPRPAPTQTESRPPPPAPPPKKTEPKKDKDEDDTDGIFGPFRIGPLIGTGLPGVLNVGGTVKLTRFLGGGVNVSVIPKVKVSMYGEATLEYQEYDAYGHIHPFGGSFFFGAGVGYATIKGSYTDSRDVPPEIMAATGLPARLSYTTRASVRSMVLKPQLGWLATYGSGFTIGFDVGAQMPIAPSEVKLETKLPDGIDPLLVSDSEKKVRDTLHKVGQQILPTLNFRIGFLL